MGNAIFMAVSTPTASTRLLQLPSMQGNTAVAQQPTATPNSEAAAAETGQPKTAADAAETGASPNAPKDAYQSPVTMDQLKAELQEEGPIGGSRSYHAKANGDVVIINHPRSVLPKTGIQSVDKLSRELTPTVDTTRSVASECFHAIAKGLEYGALTGGVVGFMLKAIPFIPQRRFGRLAWTTVAFSAIGAMYGALMGGLVVSIKGGLRVMHSADDAMHQMKTHKK